MEKKVWVLADERKGGTNQLLGIAEGLGWPYEVKDILYNKWIFLPNIIRGATLIGVTKQTRTQLAGPWPDLVLSAGRRTYPVALNIKKRSGGKTKIVQVLSPESFYKPDLLILPMHNKYKGSDPDVIQILGALNRVTPQKLTEERQKWTSRLSSYPAPRVALIVGGATKDKEFPKEMAEKLFYQTLELKPSSFFVTTSRRTPADVVQFLKEAIPQPRFFYDVTEGGENPYFGFLALADTIVVTGDSISMCSECCATGKPVYIFGPDEMIGEKHKRFLEDLYEKQYAVPLGAKASSGMRKLNDMPFVLERIKKMFEEQ